jgi:chromatin structure-remodeling complex protein RSC7
MSTPHGGDGTLENGASDIGTPSNAANHPPGSATYSARGGSARRRGRPPVFGAKNARNRGGPSHLTQVPLDKDGNPQTVVDDEIVLDEDPMGQEKVDHNGYLLGGREYRCRTFTILGRGDRLYMLSTEPARCIGFRDSYLFFQKHKQLCKIITEPEEKYDLIARKIIPHSYKGRAIGVVTARSVFREFGSRIVVGGRRVVDDFWETRAREEGAVEGELADPADKLPGAGEDYNRNQYVAWHGASSVYHTGQPSIPNQQGGAYQQQKRKKVIVTDINWMAEHASAASEFNTRLWRHREPCALGVYEPHTNQFHLPKATQPQYIRLSVVDPYNDHDKDRGDGLEKSRTDGTKLCGIGGRPRGQKIIYEEVVETRPFVGNGLGVSVGELGTGFGEWDDGLIDALETEEEKAAVRAQVAMEKEWAARWS